MVGVEVGGRCGGKGKGREEHCSCWDKAPLVGDMVDDLGFEDRENDAHHSNHMDLVLVPNHWAAYNDVVGTRSPEQAVHPVQHATEHLLMHLLESCHLGPHHSGFQLGRDYSHLQRNCCYLGCCCPVYP